MQSFWIQTPSENALSEMRRWAQVGKNLYAALRHHLLVVTQRDSEVKNGPAVLQVDWPVGTLFKISKELAKVTTFTYGVEESVTSAVTSKLSEEVMAKIGWSAGASPTQLAATVNSELSAKLGAELVESLQSGLTTNRAYKIEVSSKEVSSIEFTIAKDATTKPLFVFPKLHQVIWKVYLYQTDYLQLEYKKNRFWRDLRKTILKGTVPFHQPLFSITFFEPEMELSIGFDQYVPQVTDGTSTSTSPLEGKSPLAWPPELRPLQELARLAFPISKEEREAVKRSQRFGSSPARAKTTAARVGRPAAARRGRPSLAAGKFAAKRAVTRTTMKTAVKKAAAKKPAAKKTAKKTAAKKAATKKTAAKK